MLVYPADAWAIRSTRVFTPEGIRPAAVVVSGETIFAVVEPGAISNIRIDDVGDRYVLPGLVDAHVHLNEPGRTEWEGFETGTRAAAAGGVTTVIDMPLNSSPVTTTLAGWEAKRQASVGKLAVDVGLYAGLVPANAEMLEPLLTAGVCGVKAFLCHSGIDEFPAAGEHELRLAMPLLAAAGVPLLAHAEIVEALSAEIQEAFAVRPGSYHTYLTTRPASWEMAAIALLIRLCREYRCAVQIVHLSAANEARAMLAAARAESLPITVETCPHYLFFDAESIPDGDPRYKCAPPIRERSQADTLAAMLMSGELDTLGSDHSPAPPAVKKLETGNLREAWGGIASLELLLPVSWTALASRPNFRPERLFAAVTSRPAELVGLSGRKGTLTAGADADLIVFDDTVSWTVDARKLSHRHAITPYDGRVLQGRVEKVYLRGGRAVAPRGKLLTRGRV